MGRKVSFDLTELLSWVNSDELQYNFPKWLKKNAKITKKDCKTAIKEWNKTQPKDNQFEKEDFEEIWNRMR